jgi:rhamnogalacturonyl hydrolase YesR
MTAKALLLAGLCLAAIAPAALAAAPTPVQSVPAAAPVPWKPAEVIALAEKVGDWQLATLAAGLTPNKARNFPGPKGWEQGALFVGLTKLADHSDTPQFRQAILARGEANGWALGDRLYHADDHVIGQSYLWARENGAGPESIADIRKRFDEILANPSDVDLAHSDYGPKGVACDKRWCWCDALFMSPPAWMELSRITGDPKYLEFAKKEYWAAHDYLYDKEEHLYYRDSRFFDRRDINGRKVFWSRGDGWVFAGLALIMQQLPKSDPDRPRFIQVFKEMAAKLASIQKDDGYWSPSLLSDPATALPESSGTGFYTYGFAWGINEGILDRATYEPTVRKGWTALVRSVHPDGKLGYVQPVSDRPDAVEYSQTHFYGVGAFLLAATAIADMKLTPVAALKTTVNVENPSSFDQPAAFVSVPVATLGHSGKGIGGWSVVSGGKTYAAQFDSASKSIEFALPMKARQISTVSFLPVQAPLPRQTQAILNVQEGGKLDNNVLKGGVYYLRHKYQVPADHFIHDGLVAFEGIGWESDKAAYRLYLDERYAGDVYGKKLPRPILQTIGQGSDDYHQMADWGQDVLQVGQSLGMGSIGEVRNGKATQLGKGTITAEANVHGPVSAGAIVETKGFNDGKATLVANYEIRSGSALTHVDARATGDSGPMAAGIVHHKDVTVLKSDAPAGKWGYVASWGKQSLAGDDLGMVLFYPEDAVASRFNDDGQTVYVTFKDASKIRYAYAATWAQDSSGVRDLAGFKSWIAATLDGLNKPARVVTPKKK